MKCYEMKVVVQYKVNVLAESEDAAKKAADHYFDNMGLYADETLADSECTDEFDDVEDADGDVIVARGYGYDYWEDVKEDERG